MPPHADTMGGVFGIMCSMVLRHRDDMGTRTHLCSAAVLLFLFAALGLRVPAATYCFQTSENRSDLNSSVCNAAEVPAKLEIGDTIDLSLPEGVAFSLSIVAAPPAGIAGQSYIAHDANSEASAVVKPTKDGLRVTVDDFENRRIYSVRVKDGVVTSSVRDVSAGDGGDVCGTCAAAGGQASAAASSGRAVSTKPPMSGARLLASPADAFPIAEHNPVVDILVAFDQGAKAWAESSRWPGGDTIEEFADYAVNKMNTVLENSQLLDKFSYRLVGVVEVDATYTAVEQSVLLALQSGSGALAKVAEMREKCGADTTTLLVNRTSPSSTTTGVGFSLNGTNDTDYASFAAANKNCNVCHIQRVYDRYTMSHETGHNMGCGHSNTQQSAPGPEPGPFPYSCGYHFTDAHGVRRHTVMAYQSDGVYTYNAVPYFSSPEIIPDEYGVPLGKAGTNDNRQVLFYTHSGVSTYREHVVPYDWDVRFLDDNGNDIPDGICTYRATYVTLAHSDAEATIYYTLDGSTPAPGNAETKSCAPGTRISSPLYAPVTVTACAVVSGEAQSFRTLTLRECHSWSGESGRNGCGIWTSADSSVRSWNNSSEYFINGHDDVEFPYFDDGSSPTVTVRGVVSPKSASFSSMATSYTFEKGSDNALISLSDASFAPRGDLTFNLPVRLAAVAFTNPASHTVAFNAPFGQTVTETTGYCTNFIGIGSAGTLVVAPGADKTQTFDHFSNVNWFYNNATFRVGEGTVVFNGPINGGKGLFGSTKLHVGSGGSLVFKASGATGSGVDNSSLTVEGGGTVTFDNDMEHLRRSLVLSGGTLRSKTRLDFMYGAPISVTADSAIEAAGGSSKIYIRFADAKIDVAVGSTLSLGVPITSGGPNSSGFGLIKTGAGELAANAALSHDGATIVSNGTLSVGYSSVTTNGTGWTVASGATLKVKQGCSVALPSLSLESGAALCLPFTNSAPLSVVGAVDLSGVRLVLHGDGSLAGGASYPLVAAQGGFAGVGDVVLDDMPELEGGRTWAVAVEDGVLRATVVDTVLNVAAGETIAMSDIGAGITTIVGKGTVLCDALPSAALGWNAAAWQGTVWLTNVSTTTLPLDYYGNSGSTVRLTGVSGYPGKSGGTNIYFRTTVELVDGADGAPAWTVDNGYSTDCTFIDRLTGDGTLESTLSPSVTYVRQGFVVADASGFTGSLELVGTQFTFGTTARKNDTSQNGTIYVDAGYSVTNAEGATWRAANLVVNGKLVKKGTLSAPNSVTFGAGASFVVDSLPDGGAALTSKAIATNGVLSVSVLGDDRDYVAKIVENGDSTRSLVFERAPLPAMVQASITVRYWGDDGWEDRTFDFDLPTQWLTNYYPSVDYAKAVAAKYNETAANGAKVWQCYMLGLDPTDAASGVSLSMTVAGNKIRFAVDGLGETHALDGIQVQWRMKTSTNLVSDAVFSNVREYTTGLSPTFADHDMPDKATAYATQTSDRLFYKITVTFVAEDVD